ncbi:MAG TPA: diguanylate cyclase [Acidimicrobiia bacterium]|nr:diguanylate cyclase [Acidimicrobiia bacterium]
MSCVPEPALELQRAAGSATHGELVDAVVRHSRDVIVVFDGDGLITFVSGAIEETIGWRPDDLVGTDGRQLIHPDDLADWVAHLERLVQRPAEPSSTEARIRRRNGEWIWTEVIAVNLLGDPVVRGLVGQFRDITTRKAAEDALAASEQRFRSLVQNGFDLVAITDRSGKLKYISPSCESVLGYPPDLWYVDVDVDAATVFDRAGVSRFVHEDDVHLVNCAVLAIAERPGAAERVRCRFLDAGGGWHWFECVFTNQLGVPGVDGYVANCREVTDTVEAIDALVEQEAKFAALVRYSSDLIVVIDPTGMPSYVSPSIEHVLGFTAYEFMGPDPLKLALNGPINPWSERFRDALAEPGVQRTSLLRTRHANGQWLDLEVRATNLIAEPAIGGVVFHIRDVTDQRIARAELERRALHDPLTDLPNRALLWDRLAHSLAASARRFTAPAVLFVDIDGFKTVNDTLGHDVGDQLLVQIAWRLGELRRRSDTAARLGGDEFVILLEDISDRREAAEIGQRVCDAIAEPFSFHAATIAISASIGVVYAGDHRKCTAETLVRAADAAMYQAKKLGGNRVEVARSI